MYKYNLIIKAGRIEDMDALVNQQLTRRFGPDVHYVTHAKLTNEVIVIVMHESKRTLQITLGDWFAEQNGSEVIRGVGYPEGTLLHFRQITPDEPIYNQLGG